jgi:hypothetical protein
MTSRGQPGNRTRQETLASLLALAPRLPGPWFTSSAYISLAPVVVRAAHAEWIVHVSAHAVRKHLANPPEFEFAVILTIRGNKLPRSESGLSQVRKWQRGITSKLRDLGYGGRWAPGGPFAYFSKDVDSLARIPATVRKLQQVRF